MKMPLSCPCPFGHTLKHHALKQRRNGLLLYGRWFCVALLLNGFEQRWVETQGVERIYHDGPVTGVISVERTLDSRLRTLHGCAANVQ